MKPHTSIHFFIGTKRMEHRIFLSGKRVISYPLRA